MHYSADVWWDIFKLCLLLTFPVSCVLAFARCLSLFFCFVPVSEYSSFIFRSQVSPILLTLIARTFTETGVAENVVRSASVDDRHGSVYVPH